MTDQERDNKINELYAFMQALKAQTSIPFEVAEAFSARFADQFGFSASATSANAHDESINESGAASHTVLADPDIFLRAAAADGTQYDIPAFLV